MQPAAVTHRPVLVRASADAPRPPIFGRRAPPAPPGFKPVASLLFRTTLDQETAPVHRHQTQPRRPFPRRKKRNRFRFRHFRRPREGFGNGSPLSKPKPAGHFREAARRERAVPRSTFLVTGDTPLPGGRECGGGRGRGGQGGPEVRVPYRSSHSFRLSQPSSLRSRRSKKSREPVHSVRLRRPSRLRSRSWKRRSSRG